MKSKIIGTIAILSYLMLPSIRCHSKGYLKEIHDVVDNMTAAEFNESVVPLDQVPRYHAVELLTRISLEHLPEVNGINISYNDMYLHVYEAFKLRHAYTISYAFIRPEGDYPYGVSLTIPFSEIADMYAPGILSKVLDFVRECYRAELGDIVDHSWVLILMGTHVEEIFESLITASANKFKALPYEDRYGGILAWGAGHRQVKYFQTHGFKLHTCGRPNGTCDFSQLGVPKEIAKGICLYHLPQGSYHRH